MNVLILFLGDILPHVLIRQIICATHRKVAPEIIAIPFIMSQSNLQKKIYVHNIYVHMCKLKNYKIVSDMTYSNLACTFMFV